MLTPQATNKVDLAVLIDEFENNRGFCIAKSLEIEKIRQVEIKMHCLFISYIYINDHFI